MMIETEQGIPLTHTATLHTEIKDLSSYDQHKRYEVLRRSTYNTSTFNTSHPWHFHLQKNGLLIFYPKLEAYYAMISLHMYQV